MSPWLTVAMLCGVAGCASPPPAPPKPPEIVVIHSPTPVHSAAHQRPLTKRERRLLGEINEKLNKTTQAEMRNQHDLDRAQQKLEYLNKLLAGDSPHDPRGDPASQGPP